MQQKTSTLMQLQQTDTFSTKKTSFNQTSSFSSCGPPRNLLPCGSPQLAAVFAAMTFKDLVFQTCHTMTKYISNVDVIFLFDVKKVQWTSQINVESLRCKLYEQGMKCRTVVFLLRDSRMVFVGKKEFTWVKNEWMNEKIKYKINK